MSGKKDEMRTQYPVDLIKSGVRGKYAKRIREEGTNLVRIDSDLHELFPDSASVNRALRRYVQQRKRTAT